MNRRAFLVSTTVGVVCGADGAIDRRALVRRHNPVLTSIDARSPLSVGNGEFAFTVDVTGLQSLPDLYERTVPLCTQSQWGWHSFPAPDGLGAPDLRLENFDTYGRAVGYATSSRGQEKLFNWLRENPHRLNLARIGLLLDDRPIQRDDIREIHQTLDLWDGSIESNFLLKGSPVRVRTCCHPARDCVAVVVESALRSLAAAVEFPYGSPAMNASDWESEQKHQTVIAEHGERTSDILRRLDADTYSVRLHWTGGARAESGGHRILVRGPQLDFTCEFGPAELRAKPASPAETRHASESYWNGF